MGGPPVGLWVRGPVRLEGGPPATAVRVPDPPPVAERHPVEPAVKAEPDDKRQRLIHLTDTGRKLIPRLQACWRATEGAAADLDASERLQTL